jgi:predicted site-specific integrase-resolvase
MNSKIIRSKINAGQVILYRRVSTKAQAKDEYSSQLRHIKSKYPGFSIAKSTIDHIEEVISGCADAEIRMASGLGKCLKLLKHNPHAILLVSNADRIARRADIFMLIQKQGLGQRIYDAATEMSLDDIIHGGLHYIIEKTTEAQRASRQAGRDRKRALGAKLGSTDIATQSRLGAQKKKQLTAQRDAAVFSAVSRYIHQSRGQCPPLSTISDELNRLAIRTGQGRFWTSERLSQHKKSKQREWAHALDSYARPRRRIRRIITSTQIEFRKRRDRSTAMRRLLKAMPVHLVNNIKSIDKSFCVSRSARWRSHQTNRCHSREGCRGPPMSLES